MMIGTWPAAPSSVRIFVATWYPSSLGSITSSRIRSGDSAPHSRDPSAPSPATTTSYPSCFSVYWSRRWTFGSSSTTRIFAGIDLLPGPSPRGRRPARPASRLWHGTSRVEEGPSEERGDPIVPLRRRCAVRATVFRPGHDPVLRSGSGEPREAASIRQRNGRVSLAVDQQEWDVDEGDDAPGFHRPDVAADLARRRGEGATGEEPPDRPTDGQVDPVRDRDPEVGCD